MRSGISATMMDNRKGNIRLVQPHHDLEPMPTSIYAHDIIRCEGEPVEHTKEQIRLRITVQALDAALGND